MTLYFTDGSKATFQFPQQVTDPHSVTRRVEDLLKHQYLMIAADGALMLYPLQNIRSIQVYPAPDKLPENCIKGATILDA